MILFAKKLGNIVIIFHLLNMTVRPTSFFAVSWLNIYKSRQETHQEMR